MVRLIFIKILLLLSLVSLGCYGQAATVSIIKGHWNRFGNSVCFYEVENGQLKEKTRYELSENKNFGFALALEKEGFYVIGSKDIGLTSNKFIFYIKPGDVLNVNFTSLGYQLVDENTSENKLMEEWFNIIRPIFDMSLNSRFGSQTYVEFFPALEDVILQSKGKIFNPSGNKTFDKSFSFFREYDLAANALQFLLLPNTTHPQEEDFPEYYKHITFNELGKSSKLMDYPYGNRLLKNLDLRTLMKGVSGDTSAGAVKDRNTMFEANIAEMTDEILKGELALIYADRMKTVEGLVDFEVNFSKYFSNENQRERFKQLFSKKANNATGDLAVNFRFPDVKGTDISLSDFRGKVVYIDIWATWCGPCKKEIPHLKKLEEEYKNKQVVFLGVSIDNAKDEEKWKQFLIDNDMKGIQIFAGNKSEDITGPYRVKGIPRFLLIDRRGKIISDNAPRPSSPEIKLLLDKALEL